ncbi:MAG: nitrogen fixation protein NifM [Rhodocyclales bacterium]|nr:nitrogen fixation protein NifM [Rhodocyclales bacterium]
MTDSPSPYLRLKLARELYSKAPDALEAPERKRVDAVAARQQEIEQRILASANAALVVLPEASVEACVKDIRDRYPDEPEFEADLARTGLGIAELRAAIERDLKVEAVLELVAASALPVSDTEVEIFYLQHLDRFKKPETRTLRHILITINDDMAGSTRDAAQAKIEAIRARLAKEIGRFSEQALKHSECPTAMNGGMLGKVPRGKLYAAVEAVAFALDAGELSAVVESELGFHLVLCDAIERETQVPLAEIRERVREHLAGGRRAAVQKAWIAGLFQPA